jgi:hypothetical protein
VYLSPTCRNYRQHQENKYIGTGEVALLLFSETHRVSDTHLPANMRFILSTVALLAFITGTSTAALPDGHIEA